MMIKRTDLVTVAAPGLSVKGGEQSPVLGAFPRPHLKKMITMIKMIMIMMIMTSLSPANTLRVAAVLSLFREPLSLTDYHSLSSL